MPLSSRQIANAALATMSQEELRRSVVYLDPRLLETGATASLNREEVSVTAPSLLAFVDLFPSANWGHACRYLLISLYDGETRSFDGQFPPSRESLQIIHRGEGVEDWMLLSEKRLEE